jgi:hypothetical protein
MIRLHEVCLSIVTLVIVGGCLLPDRGEAWRWDPRETDAGALASSRYDPTQSVYRSTDSTLEGWGQRAFPARLKTVSYRSALVLGAQLDGSSPLLAGTSVLPSPIVGQGPLFCSITKSGQQNQVCSTGAAANGNCSVNAAPTNDTSCSTVASGGKQVYCSSNTGSGAGPTTCSASGKATGASDNSCSAGSGASAQCSTQGNTQQGDDDNTSNQCSAGVNGASSQSQCSSGALSGTQNGAGTCSTLASGQVSGSQNNTCSVASSGASNQCSTDGSANSQCSTSAEDVGKQTNACSVAQGLAHGSCTAISNAATAQCSAFGGAVGNCSVITGPGKATPPNPVSNLCGTP